MRPSWTPPSGKSRRRAGAILTRRNIPFAFVTGCGRESLPPIFRDAIVLKKPYVQADLIAVVELLVHQKPDILHLRKRI